jgi:undecaprenyl diphosphate synthase
MEIPKFKRVPRHIAVIPDGNRRWAEKHGMKKQAGYSYVIKPGLDFYELCSKLGVEEFTFYGFTHDNTKRPKEQVDAFRDACVESVEELSKRDAKLLVVGDETSDMFPKSLLSYRKRTDFGKANIKVNFLVNYGWHWDLKYGHDRCSDNDKFIDKIASNDISRIDLVIRWGGRRRLSGMLPIQTVYSDIYVIDDMWPEFKPEHLIEALEWYQDQDITFGG